MKTAAQQIINSLPKRKAFVYIRRSQDRADRQVLSIEGQLSEAKILVSKEKFSAVYLPAESRSAFSPGRPIFNDMMDQIENGETKHIITWEAARLARNPVDSGRILWALDTGKLTSIVTPTRTYRNTTEDKFLLQIEFGVSKMYSDRISSGVKRGYAAKYERGEYPGEAPVGYLNVSIGHNRNIAPDPVKGPLVVDVFRFAASSKYTLDEVWRYAKDVLNLTSRKGNPLAKQSVYDMLRRKLYTGIFSYAGEWRKGSYEPLITADLFDQVQVAMGWKTKRERNSTHGTHYPFKGVVVCDNCGHNITAYTKPKRLSDGHTAHYSYYVCTRKSKKVSCKVPQINANNLDEILGEELTPYVLTQAEAAICLELLHKFHNEFVEERHNRLSTWRDQAKDAEQKLDKLLELRMAEEINSEEYAKLKVRYEQTLNTAKSSMAASNQSATSWLELAENFFSKSVSLYDEYRSSNEEEKRSLLLEVGSNWYLGNRKVRLTPREPYDLLGNRTSNPNWRARPDSNRRSPP